MHYGVKCINKDEKKYTNKYICFLAIIYIHL